MAGTIREQKNLVFSIVVNTLFLAGAAFVFYAGMQIMRLRQRTVGIVASVVAMIPCFTCACCLPGIPAGIWSLIVLSRADVKAAFTK